MLKDAHQIENTYISIVESIRKTVEKDSYEKTINKFDIEDPFLPYAIRYNYKSNRYEASPVNTSTQITVNVDTIVYNKDSLLCVALLDIISHYSNAYPYEPRRTDEMIYDGRAVIGCRDSVNSTFKIYPFTLFTIFGYGDIDEVNLDLRSYYFHEIAGKEAPTGTNIEGGIYTCGIGDPKFFIDAPDFKRNENGDYKFKYYLKLGEEHPFIYAGNESRDTVFLSVSDED